MIDTIDVNPQTYEKVLKRFLPGDVFLSSVLSNWVITMMGNVSYNLTLHCTYIYRKSEFACASLMMLTVTTGGDMCTFNLGPTRSLTVAENLVLVFKT